MSQISKPMTRTPPIHPTSHIGHIIPPMPPIMPPIVPRPIVKAKISPAMTTAAITSNAVKAVFDMADHLICHEIAEGVPPVTVINGRPGVVRDRIPGILESEEFGQRFKALLD